MKTSEVSENISCLVMPYSLWPHELQPTRLLCPWDSPGRNTGVGCHSFSRGSSWDTDWIQVSHIAGRFFTLQTTREALKTSSPPRFHCFPCFSRHSWWTCVWVNSENWWWTGRSGELQSMGLQTVRHDWATKLMTDEVQGFRLHLPSGFHAYSGLWLQKLLYSRRLFLVFGVWLIGFVLMWKCCIILLTTFFPFPSINNNDVAYNNWSVRYNKIL